MGKKDATTTSTPGSIGKAALALSVPYGLFISAVYLKAFWEPIGLNPFQYSSPADLLASGAASLTLMWASLAGGMAIGAWIGAKLPQSEGGPKWLLPTIFGIATLCLIGALVYFISNHSPMQWLAVGLLLHVAAITGLAYSPWVNEWLKNPFVVAIVSALLVYVPCAMLCHGSYQIIKLTDLNRGRPVDAANSDIGMTFKEPLLYVGMLGESHVMYRTESESVLLIPHDRRVTFALKSKKEGSKPEQR